MSVFDEQRARVYDAGARTIMPGYEALHEMAREALAGALDEQASARLLLLGLGHPIQAEQIGQRFPRWRWTGVDPSEPDVGGGAPAVGWRGRPAPGRGGRF